MTKKCLFFLFLLGFVTMVASAQKAVALKVINKFPAFPDSLRANGYQYDGKLYPATEHYNDSSMLLVFPAGFKVNTSVDLVIWFHGWYNTIDSANAYFKLQQQFLNSNRNAVLVIPEMAKNAPDSYGGRFENADYFNSFLKALHAQLAAAKKVKSLPPIGNIVLAGHSGAYRVIAKIASQNTLVKEILLFDGMYGQIPLYLKWLNENKQNRLVNLYTHEGGGTDEMSDTLRMALKQLAIPYADYIEAELQVAKFGVPVIFVETKRGHNDIIASPDYFELFLHRSKVLKPLPAKR